MENKKDIKMDRIIRSVSGQGDLNKSLELVEVVFTESDGEESGKMVRSLVEEIRNKKLREDMKTSF